MFNYVFNGKTVEGGIEDYSVIFDKINSGKEKYYKLEQKDKLIIIKKNDFIINNK